MAPTATVGIIANPASARDVRRVVADGSAVTTNDKVNLLRRLMTGLGRSGVERVLSMTDLAGLSARFARAAASPTTSGWPSIEFLDHEITKTAADTEAAVALMTAAGVGAIVVLGGDGTNRVVARSSGETPIVSISTGTNNAFPRPADPTVAGIAAGLVATGSIPADDVAPRTKTLSVNHADTSHTALVDVAVLAHDRVGAGAVWDLDALRELFLCFAEPWAIGLSAIGGHLRPVGRDEGCGLHVRFGHPAVARVAAPVAPGLVLETDVAAVHPMSVDNPVRATQSTGVIAVDGERLFRLEAGEPMTVTLSMEGPRAIDVDRAMTQAAEYGLLMTGP